MSHENQELLSRCVVDTLYRKFYLYSNLGNEKVVECDTIDQFLDVLEYVRSQPQLDDSVLVYSEPF
jgi:hypothetical protein